MSNVEFEHPPSIPDDQSSPPAEPRLELEALVPVPATSFLASLRRVVLPAIIPGVFRQYPTGQPSYIPDIFVSIEDTCDGPTYITVPRDLMRATVYRWPLDEDALATIFPNESIHLLMNWFCNSGTNQMSLQRLNLLVNNVIRNPSFHPTHLEGFRAEVALSRIDNFSDSPASRINVQDKWYQSSLFISIPGPGFTFETEEDAPSYEVTGFHFRSLLDAINAGLDETISETFHLFPFHEYWSPLNDGAYEPIVSELYSSQSFIDEHRKVVREASRSGVEEETFIIGLMLWSDATHLTSFGSAKLWPIYLFFGNQSKYAQAKPSNFAAHHIAYIPDVSSLPFPKKTLLTFHQLDDGDDDEGTFGIWYHNNYNVRPTPQMVTHAKRELIQAVWLKLLDERFMEAYVHGIVRRCPDGVTRRGYPRFFTHSMDYPEK
ncbi:hypothetical protein BKA70DRAFT_1104265 [Coprinopsis sp. MPI-PUGE-AT-0042]|nr:hypothetical protein BKA70DRAFT_1104265 [Coprinopsis sp. MPI-PUGE-AT-0042]